MPLTGNSPGVNNPTLDPISQMLRNAGWGLGFNPQGQFVGWGGETGNPAGGGNGTGPTAPKTTVRKQPRDQVTTSPRSQEQQATDKMDQSKQEQLNAINEAIAAFSGDMTIGTPSFADRIRQTIAGLTGPGSSAGKAVEDAKTDQTNVIADAKFNYNKINDEFQTALKTAREDWDRQKADYKNLSAQAAQSIVSGTRQSANQAISQYRAQAEASGIPRDQIDKQVRMMQRDTGYQVGSILGESAAKTNDKIAEINSSNAAILASITGGGISALASTAASGLSAEVAAAVNVLNAHGLGVDAEKTAAGLVASAETFSAQAVQALSTLKAQVAAGDRDAFLGWQQNWNSLNDQWEAIQAMFQ